MNTDKHKIRQVVSPESSKEYLECLLRLQVWTHYQSLHHTSGCPAYHAVRWDCQFLKSLLHQLYFYVITNYCQWRRGPRAKLIYGPMNVSLTGRGAWGIPFPSQKVGLGAGPPLEMFLKYLPRIFKEFKLQIILWSQKTKTLTTKALIFRCRITMILIAIGSKHGLMLQQMANTLASIVIGVKLHWDFHYKSSSLIKLF